MSLVLARYLFVNITVVELRKKTGMIEDALGEEGWWSDIDDL
jgi:hypothetical protein